jgi:hypothetical protein
LRRKVEDGIDFVLAQCTLYIGRGCDVAILESEVGPAVEDSCVVEGCAVIELVQRHDIVLRVGDYEMADKPASAAGCVRKQRYTCLIVNQLSSLSRV